MSHRENIKEILGSLPLASELWWALKGKHKPWSAHFELEGIKSVLADAVTDVKQLSTRNPDPQKVLIFASLHYWIEQASLIALALAGQGHQVSLGYLPYAEWDKPISAFDLRRQDEYARDVLRPAKEVMEIISLLRSVKKTQAFPEFSNRCAEIVKQVSKYDTMYTRQIEEVPEGDPLFELRMARNSAAASSLLQWFQAEKPDVVIVPNGTILEMGVAYAIARLLGIRVVTFEFADQRERIWVAQDSEIMSHDTTALWQALGNQPLPDKARESLMSLFAARRKATTWGDFARRWQASPQQGPNEVKTALQLDERPIGLLATNVLGDSLTLGREKISTSMADWIVKTIEWFTVHPEVQLVVRVHPGELLTHGTSMVQVIHDCFETLPENIHIIKPDEKVNTYDLVDITDFGLVYTTTVGLEMAMGGIPVIVTGKTHYANKGFTLDPLSWDEYLNLLAKVTKDPKNNWLTQSQVEQAWLYAYLFFFEFSLPFPWHLLWLAEDFKTRPLRYVLNAQEQRQYRQTFDYLVGKPLNWKERGFARMNEQLGKVKNAN